MERIRFAQISPHLCRRSWPNQSRISQRRSMVSINLAARHRISNVVLRCSILEPQNESCMTAVRNSCVWDGANGHQRS